MNGVRRVLGAAGIYGCISLLLFGRDVIGHLAARVVGDTGADKTLYMWSLEWWPFALEHGRNPLDVDVAWVPHGYDLGLGTAGGGLALAAAPLTGVAGPVVTYNLLILAAPALAATTAFLLAHWITRAFGPSLVAGFAFGFSSYETGRMLGHLPLAFTALVPLVPYLVLRRNAGELSGRIFVALLTAVLIGQFLIVTQIFFTIILLGVVTGAAAFVAFDMPVVRRTLRETAAAVVVAIVLLSPILVYALMSDAVAPPRSPFSNAADVLNYLVPTRRTWLRPPGSAAIANRFTGGKVEQGAYLGLPFVGLAVLAALARPHRRSRRLLALAFVAAVVLSFGTRIKVAGEVVGIGPWSALAPLPVLGSATPARMTMYTALLGGLLVALALSDRGSVARWTIAVIGIVVTLPNLQLASWSSDVPRPAFFAQGCDRLFLAGRPIALVLPYGASGWSMLWQAESRFRFRLVGGHFAVRVVPKERAWEDVYKALRTGGTVEPGRLRAFLRAHRVDVVIVAPGTRRRTRQAIHPAVRAPSARVLDTLVYSVRSPGTPPRSSGLRRVQRCG